MEEKTMWFEFKAWKDKINRWYGRSYYEQINRQNIIRLTTYFQRIKVDQPDNPLIGEIQEQLTDLQKEGGWDKVKSIELLLVPLLNTDDLDMELHYQLHNAQVFLPAYESGFFKEHSASLLQKPEAQQQLPDTDDIAGRKRALLTRLIVSLQQFHEDRVLRSIFANKACFKIGLFFGIAIAFSVFLLAIGILHPEGIYQYCSRYCPQFAWVTSITAEIADPTETQQTDKIHLHFAIAAVMAGYMGACFNMLISLKGRIETITLKELENLHKLHFILTRIGAALICYYFFRAQLLTGSLFPYFTLIIWCFIAGFSEKLVPSILSKTEGQLAET